jgi:integrase/recombinase XerD
MSLPVITSGSGKGVALTSPPRLIVEAGTNAEFAWSEYFSATIRNPHTRRAYLRIVTRFLSWVEPFEVSLDRITPSLVARFIDEYPGTAPSRKLALSAIRSFFDLMTVRHAVFINPAASVRGERYSVVEGKTPEISKKHARQLLATIDTSTPVGLRDRAIFGVLIYTAARAGAVAGLRHKDFTWDGTQYSFRFREKGGKSRSIPCRADLQEFILSYLELIEPDNATKDAPLFRTVVGRTNKFSMNSIRGIDVCRMVKRRLTDIGLPSIYSPHSFRVTTLTDLLEQGVSLEDTQYLAGHVDPRTTRLYDRRTKKVTRNMVERISI